MWLFGLLQFRFLNGFKNIMCLQCLACNRDEAAADQRISKLFIVNRQ